MKGIAAIALGIVVAAAFTGYSAGQEPVPEWLNKPQTFGMLPLIPDEAVDMGISVNGIWAGFGGGHPILTFPPFVQSVGNKYGTDAEAFVSASHDADLLVVCGINGIEGMQDVRKGIENWETLSCRNADGENVLWGNPDEQCYIMCTNNPDWVRWEIDYGIRGIELGADVILIDTPQGQAIANLFSQAGFCSACMKTFRDYLNRNFTEAELKSQFKLDTWEESAVVNRLRMPKSEPGVALDYQTRIKGEPLYGAYLQCMEEASFNTRKTLVDALRSHAQEQGRSIAISANAFNLGMNNPFGYWIRALMFADLLDFFAYENSHCPNGLPFEDVLLPQGKWAPYHRLAHAVKGTRSAAVVGAGAMGRTYFPRLAEGKTVNTWMGVLAAEAYAANGAYVMYYFDAPANARETMWAQSTNVARFVRNHEDLYTGPLQSGSDAALLVLANDRGRSIPGVYPSYLGFAQAFTEGSYPIDVRFAGDDVFIADKLTGRDLSGYKTLLIPSPIDPTENQQKVVREFIAAGGTVLCQEPERLGLQATVEPAKLAGLKGQFKYEAGTVYVLEGEITSTANSDAASRFFASAQESDRRLLHDLAEGLGLRSILPDQRDGRIAAFPIVQPGSGRYIVNLVNYDIDNDADTIRPAKDIRVTPDLPKALGRAATATLFRPELETPLQLKIETDGSVLVPAMEIHASLVIEVEAR